MILESEHFIYFSCNISTNILSSAYRLEDGECTTVSRHSPGVLNMPLPYIYFNIILRCKYRRGFVVGAPDSYLGCTVRIINRRPAILATCRYFPQYTPENAVIMPKNMPSLLLSVSFPIHRRNHPTTRRRIVYTANKSSLNKSTYVIFGVSNFLTKILYAFLINLLSYMPSLYNLLDLTRSILKI
jgi:hypothetical protein